MPHGSKVIIDYLKYLKDISRKIGSRSGFDKILLDKNRKSPSMVFQSKGLIENIGRSDQHYSHFHQVFSYLNKNQEKKLFLGVGVCAGKYKEKTIAAPLLITECQISKDDNSGKI